MGEFEQWLREAAGILNVDYEVLQPRINDLLDLTKHVAHGPSRPAAPLTAFLVGVAAGAQSEGTEATAETAKLYIDNLIAHLEKVYGTGE